MKDRSAFARILLVAIAVAGISGCGSSNSNPGSATGGGPQIQSSPPNLPIRHEERSHGCCAGAVYATRATGYYPSSNAMEGGFADRRGVKLHTLQDYLDGRVTTVAVAMDKNAFPYGTKLCIPELNRAFGRTIPFRVVDTGDAFRSKGTSRIDICTRTRKDAGANAVNRNLEIIACDP